MKFNKYVFITLATCLNATSFSFGFNGKNIEPSQAEFDIKRMLIDSLVEEGILNYRSDSELLLRSGTECLVDSRTIGYKKGEAKALLNLTIYHTLYGKKDTALILSQQSMNIARELGEFEILTKTFHYRGLNYQQSGKYQDALSEYIEALTINTEYGYEEEILKQTNNIAIVYRELKDYESAMKYLQKTHDIAVKLGKKELIVYSTGNMAYIFLDQKRYKEAYEILRTASQGVEDGNKLTEHIINNLISQSLTGLGRYDEAINSAYEAIEIGKELNYSEGVFNATYAIANAYFEQQEFTKALQVAEQAIKDPNAKWETRYVQQLYKILSHSCHETNNFKKAFKYQEEYLRLSELIYNEDQQKYATRLKIEYDLQQQERENQILKDQNVADKKQIRNQQIIYISTSLIALLGLGLAFLFYKTTKISKVYSHRLETAIDNRTKDLQKANKELKNSNYELERFAFIASHDLKEPLKNVISFSELIQKEVKEDPSSTRLIDYANFVERGSKRLFALVHSIFEFSRIEKDLLKDGQEVNLELLVENLKEDYDSKAEITIGELPKVTGNPSLIYTVLQNLIQNGIKYNKNEKVLIHIDSKKEDNMQVVSLTDNGIGFNDQFQEKVFDMFTRLNTKDEYEGAGLGLAICKKVMNAHKGEIWVESEEGKGSTFHLSFPLVAA